MTIYSTPTSTCLPPLASCNAGWLSGTAGTCLQDESLASSSCTPSSKKSGGLRPPANAFLKRRQWVLRHQESGLYLQAIERRQVIWTKHPGMAHSWLSTEPIRTMLLTDPELFGDPTQLFAVEFTYIAHLQAPHHWFCNA